MLFVTGMLPSVPADKYLVLLTHLSIVAFLAAFVLLGLKQLIRRTFYEPKKSCVFGDQSEAQFLL